MSDQFATTSGVDTQAEPQDDVSPERLPVGATRGRTFDGSPLTPGVNVDKINIENGIAAAKKLGWIQNGEDQMVVDYALRRHARGEESGAQQTWMSHFGKANLTGWFVVLANGMTA